MKKKRLFVAGILGVMALSGGLWFILGRSSTSGNEGVVFVSEVRSLMNQGSLGIQQRFSGVVEPQQVYDVEVQPDRSVKEVLVKKGQDVVVGTPLFTYDTEQSQNELSQAELDLERLENDVTNLNAQIGTLEKEKRAASKEEKLNYTTQIQTAQNDIKKTEYEIKSKKMEIERLKENIENATVVSEIAGVIKSVNQSSNSEMYYVGENSGNAFITILETGEFRVKGMVNEQNMYSIIEGAPVIIRSRVDDSVWYGTMGMVDTENGQTGNNNNMYYYGGMEDTENQSSKYPFYVSLHSDEGLMLGQHVYIEMDMGQEEERIGVWLPEYLIADIDSDPYVWADNGRGKLTKKSVILGQYDENLMEYEIADGLTEEDAVTFPEESLREGLKTEITTDGSMGNQVLIEDVIPADEQMIEGGGIE